MNEFGSLPRRLTGPVRAGLVCVPALCGAVWLGLLRYPPDVAGLVLVPSLAMFVLSVRRPTLAICAIVFLFPLLPLLPTNLGIANVSLLGYLLLAMAAGRAVAGISGKGPVRLPARWPVDVPVFVLLACIWISCLTVPSRYTLPWNRVFVADFLESLPRIFFYREGDLFLSLSAAVLFSLGAFFFWQLRHQLGQIGMQRILILLLAGAALSILFAFYQRTTGGFIPEYWVREGQVSRVNGLFPDPNSFGTYIVSLLFLFSLCRGRTNRLLFRITAGFLFLTLVFTGSRAAWLSFLLVICGLGAARAYRFLTRERTSDLKKVKRVILIGLVILLLLAYVGYEYALRADTTQEGGSYLGRILTLFNRSDTFNHILKGRPTMWYAALSMMREFPAAGVGVGLYREVMPHFLAAGQTYWWERKKENAHNYFLQVGGEMGFPGLVALVWLCVTVLAVYLEARKKGTATAIQRSAFWGLLAFLLTTLGAHPLIQIEIQILFWILVVLLCSGLNDRHEAHAKTPRHKEENHVRTPGASTWLTQRRQGAKKHAGAAAPRAFGAGILVFSLVASLWQAGNLFPYQLYDLGVNTWENMGRPGAWTAQREWFRWTKGAAILLFRPEEPRLAMRFKLGRPGVAPGESVEVRTRLGEGPEERFILTGEGEKEIVLDFVGLEGNVVPLRIRSSSVWRGLRVRGQRDWRTLGVRVYRAFPPTYAPGYTEGLQNKETREGLSVRLLKDEEAFLWKSVDGRILSLPIWVENPREKGTVRIFLDLEHVATLRLERRGWQPLQFPVREPIGDSIAVTLRMEDAEPGLVGVGRISWLP